MGTEMKNSISVVIPMLNERDYIRKTVNGFTEALERNKVNYEIIIVDDYSSDGSEKISDELSIKDERVKVIHIKRRLQFGSCLRLGFSFASCDWIFYTDCDLPFDLGIIDSLLEEIKGDNVILGFRIGKRESLLRSFYSAVYNYMIKSLFHLKVKDVNFALKIFRKDILNELRLESKTAIIDAELLIKTRRLGYEIKEVGVEYQPRIYGRSKLASFRPIAQAILELIRMYSKLVIFPHSCPNYD